LNFIGIDLEGVLVPEIWMALAKSTGVEELKLTTKNVVDYQELMDHRINILNLKGINAEKLFEIAKAIKPYDGAVEFLDEIRKNYQVIILSDTFYNLSHDIFLKLKLPTVFCHKLLVSKEGKITGFKKCVEDHKRKTIQAMNKLNFNTLAVGDSYNDLNMLKEAKNGILFKSTEEIKKKHSEFFSCESYSTLTKKIHNIFKEQKIDK
tara:strand:+ start:132 stop:752 length:621 start_codon:yes stop_codon:yes gene_type:complete